MLSLKLCVWLACQPQVIKWQADTASQGLPWTIPEINNPWQKGFVRIPESNLNIKLHQYSELLITILYPKNIVLLKYGTKPLLDLRSALGFRTLSKEGRADPVQSETDVKVGTFLVG